MDEKRIINEHLRVSDVCIFSVPTPYFKKKMLGNKRFIDICKKPKRIFKPIALYVFVLKEKEEEKNDIYS